MLIFNKYLKKYIGIFGIAIFFLLVESMADLLQPLLFSKLIDDGIGTNDLNQVVQIGLQMVVVALVGLVCALIRNYASTHVSYSFSRDLRMGLYHKLLKMSMIQVEDIERGSMINRLSVDVNRLQMFVNGLMRIFLKAPMLGIGSFIMVLQLDRRFLVVYLAVIPVVLGILFINLKIGYPLYAKIQAQLDQLNKKTMEYLNGIRVVKAFNRTEYEKKNFKKVNKRLKETSTFTMRVMGIFNPLIMLCINLAIVAVLYMSPGWIKSSNIGVGQVVAFVNYMTQLLFAITIMNRVFNMFIRAKTSNERLQEILELEVPELKQNQTINEKVMSQGIRVENMSFRFGEGDFALEGISFKLESGKSLGIIGTTGSGKSTLVNVLAGLLESTKGDVYIGNERLSVDNISSYRQYMSYVPQDKILFSETVYNNLKMGMERNGEKADLEMAIQVANAQFIYDMEKGLETRLGKGGVNISGGQKQRLAIARALLKKPSLLILDDSTSALDAITEKEIFNDLSNLNHPMSLIVIGQKISTVKMMDEILVLDNGRMAGLGTHNDLLSNCAAYKNLYEVQMGGA